MASYSSNKVKARGPALQLLAAALLRQDLASTIEGEHDLAWSEGAEGATAEWDGMSRRTPPEGACLALSKDFPGLRVEMSAVEEGLQWGHWEAWQGGCVLGGASDTPFELEPSADAWAEAGKRVREAHAKAFEGLEPFDGKGNGLSALERALLEALSADAPKSAMDAVRGLPDGTFGRVDPRGAAAALAAFMDAPKCHEMFGPTEASWKVAASEKFSAFGFKAGGFNAALAELEKEAPSKELVDALVSASGAGSISGKKPSGFMSELLRRPKAAAGFAAFAAKRIFDGAAQGGRVADSASIGVDAARACALAGRPDLPGAWLLAFAEGSKEPGHIHNGAWGRERLEAFAAACAPLFDAGSAQALARCGAFSGAGLRALEQRLLELDTEPSSKGAALGRQAEPSQRPRL